MLNEHLFDDKKDIEIARLKKVIEDFKEYDEKRKRYYAEKMRRLGELESLLCEINEAEESYLKSEKGDNGLEPDYQRTAD